MGFSLSAPPVVLGPAAYDLENYDDSDTWDLNTYGETDDFDDMDEEVRGGFKSFVSSSILSSFIQHHIVVFSRISSYYFLIKLKCYFSPKSQKKKKYISKI